MARRLAVAKCASIMEGVGGDACVLGCDTIVVFDAEVLGKPDDEAHAEAMLLRLASKTHEVVTGYAVFPPASAEPEVGTAHSLVTMRAVSPGEAAAYAASGEPLDKAGAYALQGDGSRFVERVDGSRSNVIGLPLEAIVPILVGLGIPRRPVHSTQP